VAVPKAQMAWWLRLDMQNLSIMNNNPGRAIF
jgi:hypothetical protein